MSRIRPDELSPQMLEAASLDAAGLSDRQIADELQCSTSLVCKWRKDPIYRKRKQDLLQALADSALERVQGLVGAAVDALKTRVEDGDWDAVKMVLDRVGILRSAGKGLGLAPDTEARTGAINGGPAIQITLNVDQQMFQSMRDAGQSEPDALKIIDAEAE